MSVRVRGYDVVVTLDRLFRSPGRPKTIHVSNGSAFTSKAMVQWAYFNQVELDFSRLGEPADNAFIEPCNGELRA